MENAKQFLIVLGILFSQASPGITATRYWVGGPGRWSETSHWSDTSGGSGGQSLPGSVDDVVIDGQAGSGNFTITLDQDVLVQDLRIDSTAGSGLIFDVADHTLECSRDALLGGGQIDQGINRQSKLIVGRNLDIADCVISEISRYNLSIYLTGTGIFRYRLVDEINGLRVKPLLWDFSAAQPGHTTTLRPVGQAPPGIDIDVHNQLFLGDSTSLLVGDLTEATPGPQGGPILTIEIHNQTEPLSINVSGPSPEIRINRLELDAGERSDSGNTPVFLIQHQVQYSNLSVLDLTGDYNAPAGTGPAYRLTGPLDLGEAILSIEKTVSMYTNGFPLNIGRLHLGAGSLGTGEIHLGSSQAAVSERIAFGRTNIFAHLYLDQGLMTAAYLQVNGNGGFVTGSNGGTLVLSGAAPDSAGTTYYVSAYSGSDSNSGLSPADPLQTFNSGLSMLGTEVRVLLKRGEQWDAADNTTINSSGGIVGAYGTGTRPQIKFSLDTHLYLAGNRWEIYDLEFIFGDGQSSDIVPPSRPQNLTVD
jgi:hypothetical protein